jgi:hypothetical protein
MLTKLLTNFLINQNIEQTSNKLGKEPDMGTLPGGLFAECPEWHSATKAALPSAARRTLGKDIFVAECQR